jgi:hypothetical protein
MDVVDAAAENELYIVVGRAGKVRRDDHVIALQKGRSPGRLLCEGVAVSIDRLLELAIDGAQPMTSPLNPEPANDHNG